MFGRCDPGSASGPSFQRAVGDNLAVKYSSLAGDGSKAPQVREAAMLFSAAEKSLNEEEDVKTALSKASEALALFREVGDSDAVADVLRLLCTARLDAEEPDAALELATTELEKFRTAGDRRGEAAMLLSSAEITFNNFGSKRRDEALESAEKARHIYKELKDAKMEGIALLSLANGHISKAAKHDSRQEFESAAKLAQEALVVVRSIQDRTAEAKALHSLAITHASMDDLEEANRFAKQALAVWRELGIKKFEGMELRCLAEWQLASEQPEEALKLAQAAHKFFEEVGNDKGWEAASLGTVVRCHLKKQELDTAQQLVKDAMRRFQSKADEAGEVQALSLMVEVQLARDDKAEAFVAAEKCLDAVRGLSKRTLQDKKFEASLLHTIAQIHVAEENHKKALECCDESMKLYKDAGDKSNAALVLHTVSNANLGLSEFRAAIKAAGESRDIFRKRNHKRGHAYSCMQCSSAYARRGEHNRAISMTKEALKVFTEEKLPKGEAEALSMLGEVYLMRGNALKSLNYARESRELYRELGQSVKELEELFIMTRASFWVAQQEGTPQKKGEKPSAAWDEALSTGQEALAAARKNGPQSAVVAALFGVGQVYVITRRPEEAAKLINEALPQAKETGDERAEANLEVLTSQMHIMNGQDNEAVEPGKRAVDIFRDKLHDPEGVDIAMELIRFVEGGGSGPQQPEPEAGGAEASQAGAPGAVAEYQGPSMEDLVATISDVALSLMGVESLAGDTPLMDAGLDSLASVEFQNNLTKEFRVQLPSTLVFDFPSVNTMAEFINGSLREAAGFQAVTN